MKKELLKGLTKEQIAKVKACKNHEELMELAKKEGVSLTEEQLAVVSGGGACTVIQILETISIQLTVKDVVAIT